MKKKNIKKYTIIQDFINGIYTVPQAANVLKQSDRQVQRLKKKVKVNGPKGAIHKSKSKKSNNAIDEDKNVSIFCILS